MNESFTETRKLPCEKCLEFIHLMLDGEASENEITIVNLHLQECNSCNGAFILEVEIRKALKSRVLPQPLPVGLLHLIKDKIATPDTHP
jgi:predicted anti-sigma-YlaC factor YlaD